MDKKTLITQAFDKMLNQYGLIPCVHTLSTLPFERVEHFLDNAPIHLPISEKLLYAAVLVHFDIPLHNPATETGHGAWFVHNPNISDDYFTSLGLTGFKNSLIATGLFRRISVRPVYQQNVIMIDNERGSKFDWNAPVPQQPTWAGVFAYVELTSGYSEELFMPISELATYGKTAMPKAETVLSSLKTENLLELLQKATLRLLVQKVQPFNNGVQDILATDNLTAAQLLDYLNPVEPVILNVVQATETATSTDLIKSTADVADVQVPHTDNAANTATEQTDTVTQPETVNVERADTNTAPTSEPQADKPKRKRRTKAEIQAAKQAQEEAKAQAQVSLLDKDGSDPETTSTQPEKTETPTQSSIENSSNDVSATPDSATPEGDQDDKVDEDSTETSASSNPFAAITDNLVQQADEPKAKADDIAKKPETLTATLDVVSDNTDNNTSQNPKANTQSQVVAQPTPQQPAQQNSLLDTVKNAVKIAIATYQDGERVVKMTDLGIGKTGWAILL